MSRVIFGLVLSVLTLIVNPLTVDSKTFKKALPGYIYKFPEDHRSHGEFKTEWWYYTGHLESKEGKEFGFELTFFRVGLDSKPSTKKSPWSLDNVYLAHFAVTDLDKKRFQYSQKLNRRGLKLAHASETVPYVFNEQWKMIFIDDKIQLSANQKNYSFDLLLTPKKAPVVHGINGVSQKAECKGCASHYYSLSRLDAKGYLFVDGKPLTVKGQAWMDHEFGSNQLTESQVGWDWFSIQLDDNSELMLYLMRKKDGTIDKHSSGTLVFKDGKTKHLSKDEFKVSSKRIWTSSKTKGKYPLEWTVNVPEDKISLNVIPLMDDQELVTGDTTGVSYWEGACKVSGTNGGKPVKGKAYVEMTGYAEVFKKRI